MQVPEPDLFSRVLFCGKNAADADHIGLFLFFERMTEVIAWPHVVRNIVTNIDQRVVAHGPFLSEERHQSAGLLLASDQLVRVF